MGANDYLDLEALVEETKPYFYLKLGHSSKKIHIRRFEENSFYCDAHPEILALKTVEGFMVAKNQKGIIYLICDLVDQESREAKFDIVQLKVRPGSAKSVNRREFLRLDMIGYHPVTIHPKSGQAVYGKLLNLSAGGALIELTKPLDRKKIYRITTSFPMTVNDRIDSAFLTVYDYNEADDAPLEAHQNSYGIHFIRDQKVTDLPVLSERKQEEMVRVLNMALVERRKSL